MGCPDRLIWHYFNNGSYTVRTGYGVAIEMEENGKLGRKETGAGSKRDEGDWCWGDIWRLVAPNKLKFFIWQCCNHSLAVGINLLKR